MHTCERDDERVVVVPRGRGDEERSDGAGSQIDFTNESIGCDDPLQNASDQASYTTFFRYHHRASNAAVKLLPLWFEHFVTYFLLRNLFELTADAHPKALVVEANVYANDGILPKLHAEEPQTGPLKIRRSTAPLSEYTLQLKTSHVRNTGGWSASVDF